MFVVCISLNRRSCQFYSKDKKKVISTEFKIEELAENAVNQIFN